ncbi:MAG: glycosyltransferase family 39 protein [Thaumarchaeota archaeon]|nr:glycosyltransferase family 39 protein [Nitrososphaerota archaeon]
MRFSFVLSAVLALASSFVLLFLVALHAYSPILVPIPLLFPPAYILAAMSAASAFLGTTHLFMTRPELRRAILFLLLLTGGILVSHFYIIGVPATADCYSEEKQVYGCIMDEVYYVPAAQTLLSGTKCEPYLDNCNMEHPFLSKAFIAAGIQIFGLNVFGWRSFQVLMGSMSIPVLFAICLAISPNRRLAYYASLFFAFDTLFFVHSSIAVIDAHAIFFALLSFLVYLRGTRIWRLNRYVLSGIFLGLSGLSKETSIFFVLFLLSYHSLFGDGAFRKRIYGSMKILVCVVVVFALGTQIYDSLFTTSAVHSFLDHVRFILSYGSSLTGKGWTDSQLGTPITPIDWMLYYTPIGYLVTTVTVNSPSGTISYIGAGYYGITNKLETWLTFLWAPFVLVVLAKRSLVERASRDFRAAAFALVWFLWTYFPYIILYALGRVTYPYYIIQAIPAIAIGCAYVTTRDWFPRVMAWVFLAATFGWFFLYYPYKEFLPVWLRILLGR